MIRKCLVSRLKDELQSLLKGVCIMRNIIRKSIVIATLFSNLLQAYQPQQFFLDSSLPSVATTYWDEDHAIEIVQTIEPLQLVLSEPVPIVICFEVVDSSAACRTREQLLLLTQEYSHEKLKAVVIDPSRSGQLAQELRSLMLPPDFPIAEPMYIFIYKKEVLLPALSGRYDNEDMRTFIDHRFAHYGLQQRPGVVGYLRDIASRASRWIYDRFFSYFW